MKIRNQPWLGSPRQEIIFILAPALIPVFVIFIFQDYFTTHQVNTWWWVILVICIDVSHVYSTLFRLYWDKKTFDQYKHVLVAIPVIAFLVGFGLHQYSSLLFWRVLAYVAVYHFVRQQYGFMRLYSRKERKSEISKNLDTVAIYNATLYPLLYWHIHATNQLTWFVKGDFLHLALQDYEIFFRTIYFGILAAYIGKEIYVSYRQQSINLPKNLLITGTYASWYVGIVAFQGDLIFTLLNIVAHGIPYMALIWIHGQKKIKSGFNFNMKGVGIFIFTLLTLAYVEELFWEGMIWKEHPEVFPVIFSFLSLQEPIILSIVIALLVLPQVTHYVLDGFIWRFSRDVQARME